MTNRQKRHVNEQKRQVSKVLLDGLYDPHSPLSMLLGVRNEIMGEIIWQVCRQIVVSSLAILEIR